MSFGWGINDIQSAIKGIIFVVNVIRNGPKQYEELLNKADSLRIMLENLCDAVRGPGRDGLDGKAARRKSELQRLVNNCRGTITNIQNLLNKNKALGFRAILRIGFSDINSININLQTHITMINTFIASLTHQTVQHMANRPTGSAVVGVNNNSHQHQHFYQFNHINPQIQIPSCPPFSNNSGDVHPAIFDGCERTIRGVRYQCHGCADFDHCGDCFRTRRKREHHPGHFFQAMNSSDESRRAPAYDPYMLPANAPYLLLESGVVELDDVLGPIPDGPLTYCFYD